MTPEDLQTLIDTGLIDFIPLPLPKLDYSQLEFF